MNHYYYLRLILFFGHQLITYVRYLIVVCIDNNMAIEKQNRFGSETA
jgi:hypothetical protein